MEFPVGTFSGAALAPFLALIPIGLLHFSIKPPDALHQ